LREIPQNTHRNNKKGIVYVVHSYFGWKVQNNIRWVRSWSPSVSSDIGLGYQRRKTLYIKKEKQGQEPINQMYKAKERRSRHNSNKK